MGGVPQDRSFVTTPFSKLPGWLKWNQYCSWFRYAFEIGIVNQWKGVEHGSSVIQEFGFKEENVPFDIGMLLVLDVAFRILAFLALLLRTRRN